ncbi:HEAT repeat domain-containing protein [Nocardia harenae]|uniref:HEAT repeat domain-containing protein n=1 Tax=Nocardia harenae TaxID=358707 RepID=UPI00082C7962|nr:HEAT repeat domain-containing protein [Nocardia harenae]
MNPTPRLRTALNAESASTRLQAALAAGTHPDPALLPELLARCAVEPDFYVRDMLTWALTRLPREDTVPALLAELASGTTQARSQALHTLSKIGDPATWSAITPALLRDPDDEVARSAWRAAAVLVPEDERPALAAELAGQLARGDRDVRRSLSRALAALGEIVEPVLTRAKASPDPDVRAHALVTEQLLRDPDAAFDIDAAKRIAALDGAPC